MPKSAKNNTHKRRGKPPEKREAKIFTGKYSGNARGFGFVCIEDGEDIFIPPAANLGALHGDEVRARLTDAAKREGKIIEIAHRASQVGTFHAEGNFLWVNPLERKIPQSFPVSAKAAAKLGLTTGTRVIFTARDDYAHISEVIGHEKDIGVDVLTLVRRADVPHIFPADVLAESAKHGATPSNGRKDLRGRHIFTIDGADTMDIDDAISIEATPHGWRLGVHIADVAHYVPAGSATDRHAYTRGTSIYLADRVIPMLPHTLSSGICSLFSGVDRLTVSCEMDIDAAGNVTSYEISQSIINSRKQYTYDEVDAQLDGGSPAEHFILLDSLRRVLFAKREAAGAFGLNIPEAKVIVDAVGTPLDVVLRPRTRATCIIEECMIVANETVARHFGKKPAVYRFHDKPLKMTPSEMHRKLRAVRGTEAEYAISMQILQAMPQAQYSATEKSHFGLASHGYLHFTSPIRRYADLTVHRLLKREKIKNLPEIAAQCSRTERTAVQLERDVSDMKKAAYMQDKIGQCFTAVVSGVVQWGAYVMLPNTVEGLIPANTLRKRHGLELGMKINVRLKDADTNERRVTFELA